MKVCLMNPLRLEIRDFFESLPTFPHIGLASIAAYLEQNGHDVYVIDPQNEGYDLGKLLMKISDISPDILGITAYTEEVKYAGQIVEKIKESMPHVLTVIGGPHASAIPERTLREFAFDVAVVGEGEKTMLELTEAVENGEPIKKVKGIYFKDQGEIKATGEREPISDLDSLPFPAWHLFPLQKYKGKTPSGFRKRNELTLPVEGARGCPYDCSFCYRMFGRKIRFKSPKRVVDEVERDVEEFGATSIHFVEGSFAVNRKIAMEVCEELIARGLSTRIKWGVGGRVDLVDRELLEKAKQAGCSVIGYGVESGNEDILKKIGKHTTLEQIRRAINETKEVGITAGACFIIGLPYETEATISETIEVARKLDPYNPNFAILVPFPGTPVADMAKKGVGGLRLISENWSDYGKQSGNTLELESISYKRLKQLQRKAYFKYYVRPTKMPYLLSVVLSIIIPRLIMVLQNTYRRLRVQV